MSARCKICERTLSALWTVSANVAEWINAERTVEESYCGVDLNLFKSLSPGSVIKESMDKKWSFSSQKLFNHKTLTCVESSSGGAD